MASSGFSANARLQHATRMARQMPARVPRISGLRSYATRYGAATRTIPPVLTENLGLAVGIDVVRMLCLNAHTSRPTARDPRVAAPAPLYCATRRFRRESLTRTGART